MINIKNAEQYCSEDISKIENYAQAVADTTQMWHCHHHLEIQGQFRNSTALLKKCGLYYHVPASQLIFLTKSEHTRLHNIGKPSCGEKNPMFGKHHSAETRKKMSMSLSGEKNAMFGKHHSAETCSKMSNALRKLSWWNNGTINKRSKECPGEGWVRGRKPH